MQTSLMSKVLLRNFFRLPKTLNSVAAVLADARAASMIYVNGRTSTNRPSARDEILALKRALSARKYLGGSYLLNLSSWGYLEVFNTSNPTSLTRVPNASYQVPTVGYHSFRLSINGNLVAATVGSQIFLFDINANGTLTQRSIIDLPVHINAGALAANHLYVASIDGKVRVYNVSDRANPTQLTTLTAFSTPGNGAFSTVCMVDGNRLHAMFGRKGYALYDISTPGAPVMRDILNMADQDTTAMDVAGNTVYLAAMAWNGRKGVRAINISNSQNVAEVATQRATDFTVDVRALNGYVYVAEQEGGLRIRNAASGSAGVTDWNLY